MDQNQNGEFPWRQGGETTNTDPIPPDASNKTAPKSLSLGVVALLVCVAIVLSVIVTYTVASSSLRTAYVSELYQKQ